MNKIKLEDVLKLNKKEFGKWAQKMYLKIFSTTVEEPMRENPLGEKSKPKFKVGDIVLYHEIFRTRKDYENAWKTEINFNDYPSVKTKVLKITGVIFSPHWNVWMYLCVTQDDDAMIWQVIEQEISLFPLENL